MNSLAYISRSDGHRYPITDLRFAGDDGGLLDLDFTPSFPVEALGRREPSMWRYREALPLPADTEPVTLGEVFTPLLPLPFTDSAGRERTVWIKQEQLFSSGSYKDRGAALLISLARSIGVDAVVEDSSGNAGAAVAAYCARAGIACTIFTPASNSPGKLAQIRAYGARLVLTPGPREQSAQAVLAAARGEGGAAPAFYASHTYNPFFFHGTKTFAFEAWEQLGHRAPDALVLPAGNGTLLIGAAIGFAELHRAGLVARMPRIFAVQAACCAPLAHAAARGQFCPAGADGSGWSRHADGGGDTTPGVSGQVTIAEGIAIARPVRADQIISAVRETGGAFVTVSEEQIHDAHRRMARTGFCIEPTSAATIAALPEALARLPVGATVVSLFSGHGLKAPARLPVN